MELRDYLRIVRAHWIGIVVCAVLGIAVASGWAILQPKEYTAEATGYVVVNTGSDNSNGDATSNALVGNSLALSKVKSYVQMGSWKSVAADAISELKLNTTPEALVGHVKVTNPDSTVILQVTATGPTPEQARDLASAWVRGMQTEINKVEGGTAAKPATIGLSVADSARLPTSPSSPKVKLALVIGLLIGLVVGAAYAFLRYTLDRRVRSAESVESETGLTVVGTVPDEKTFSDANRLIPFNGVVSASGRDRYDLHALSESMRELRTNIQYMDVDNPPRAVVITSALPGEGKSTTSSNLAITLAASGEQVYLIDGDLRRPKIADIFGLPGQVGLTDVLAGRASVDDVSQPVGDHGNLSIVAAGKVPPNPSELLGSQRMSDLVHGLAEHAFVIIDCPPLIPVTDAAILSHNTDGAILVTSVGKTTIDALQKAQHNLERAGGRGLGVVLNRVPRKGGGSAYYGYQYKGDYYRSSEEAAPDGDIPVPAAPTGASSSRHRKVARRADADQLN